MNISVAWSKLYQQAKDIFGEDLDELKMLRKANEEMDNIRMLNLPTQIRKDFIPYVYEFERYKLFSDYKTEGIIDLRYDDSVDNNRNTTFIVDDLLYARINRNWNFKNPREWVARNEIDLACIALDKGVETLLLANGRADQSSVEISDCDSLTGFAGSGGAGNLTLDDDVKIEGDYSINYDLTSATTAIITRTLATAVDLSEYVNQGILRLFKWLPTAPSSIEIRIGSDSSNYYTQTITAQADGTPFNTISANELELSFHDATITGSPDNSAIAHFQVRLTFSSATTDTDFRIDNIKVWKPEQLVCEYYSFYMSKTSAGVWQEYLTETVGTEDEVLILPEWRRPFVLGIILDDLLKNGDSRYDKLKKEHDDWLKTMKQRYPSRAKRIGNNYY